MIRNARKNPPPVYIKGVTCIACGRLGHHPGFRVCSRCLEWGMVLDDVFDAARAMREFKRRKSRDP